MKQPASLRGNFKFTEGLSRRNLPTIASVKVSPQQGRNEIAREFFRNKFINSWFLRSVLSAGEKKTFVLIVRRNRTTAGNFSDPRVRSRSEFLHTNGSRARTLSVFRRRIPFDRAQTTNQKRTFDRVTLSANHRHDKDEITEEG